jgi:hypothetical protein
VQKWEYQHWYVKTNLERARVRAVNEVSVIPSAQISLIEALTQAGEEGWEVAGFNGWHCVLKRPKE